MTQLYPPHWNCTSITTASALLTCAVANLKLAVVSYNIHVIPCIDLPLPGHMLAPAVERAMPSTFAVT